MLKQPVGIVKLTNVALIKYKVKGKKFEIACYKNKAIDWRNGVETQLSEVLQVEEIFIDAIKGKKVSRSDLKKCFPNMDKEKIIQEILQKGTMQISEKEREQLQQNNQKDVLNIIANKIVHPKTKKKFSLEDIHDALKQINFNIVFNKIAKKIALEAIKELEKYYEIERTGKLIRIKLQDPKDWETIKNNFQFEIHKDNEPTEKTILISYKDSKELEDFILQKNQDKIQFTIQDHAYYNKELSKIDDAIQSTLQVKPGVTLPNQKNQQKQKRRELDSTAEKKEVVGFNQKQFQKSTGSAKICSTCLKAEFENLKDYKEHIKSDWHKFNLKRKMKGEDCINQDDYKGMILLDEFCK